MHGHLRGSDNEAGIVRGSLGLRCLFAAVSFAVHARSNGVRRWSCASLRARPSCRLPADEHVRSLEKYWHRQPKTLVDITFLSAPRLGLRAPDGRDDEREPIAPIHTAARDEPHALTIAASEHPKAVMFDLVQPFGPGWRDGCGGREAWLRGQH